MSKNQKHQNKIEQSCLDFLVNNLEIKDVFGLSNKQYIQLQKMLNEATPNPYSNNFPDFIFDNGFIEHFAVTSSVENKKGSKQQRESNIFKNKSKENFLDNLEKNNSDIYTSSSYMRNMEEHSHLNIMESIKRNWKKHLQSYDENITSSHTGIFLIEYIDVMLHTALINKNKSAEVHETYRISGDKHMLEWIYKYKDKIDYLILVNLISESIEVIRIDNIPYIINKFPEAIYAPAFAYESHSYINLKIKY